jgi:O-antigen/teichoic acid export membrane protein
LTKVVTLGIRFFLTPFILHRLGDTQFGLLALVGSILGQGELFDFGIRAALTKYVAEHHSQRDFERARHLIATSLWMYCALGLLALLLAAILAPLFPYLFNLPLSDQTTARDVVLLTGIQIGLALPGAAPAAVLWGLHKYGQVNALIMLSTVLSAGITIAILLAGGGLVAMVAAGIPLTIGMLALGMHLLKRAAPELLPNIRDGRRELVRSVLTFSGATFVIEAAYSLQGRTNEIVIGAFLPISAVTPYSVARRLSNVPQMVAEQTVGSFLPLASELQAEGSMDRLRLLYLVGSRITLAVCVSLAGVLIALAGPILALWLGAEYSRYSPIVIILTLASVANVSHWPGGSILQGIARHHGLATAYICAAVANLGLAALLVRPYGVFGVAVATLISSAALSLCYIWPYVARVLSVPLRDLLKQVFLPALLPIVPMIAVVYGAGLVVEPTGLASTGVTAAAAFGTYSAVYFLLASNTPERQLLQTTLTSLKNAFSLRFKDL